VNAFEVEAHPLYRGHVQKSHGVDYTTSCKVPFQNTTLMSVSAEQMCYIDTVTSISC